MQDGGLQIGRWGNSLKVLPLATVGAQLGNDLVEQLRAAKLIAFENLAQHAVTVEILLFANQAEEVSQCVFVAAGLRADTASFFDFAIDSARMKSSAFVLCLANERGI